MSQLPRFIDDGGTNRPYGDSPDGTERLRYECCCDTCTGGGVCNECDDVIPNQYTAVVSGITLCSGCVNLDTTLESRELRFKAGYSLADVNTTHTLTYVTNCRWHLDLGTIMEGRADTNTASGSDTCADASWEDFDVYVTLTLYTSGSWELAVTADGVVGTNAYHFGVLFQDFQAGTAGVNPALTDCTVVPSFTNDFGSGNCGEKHMVSGTSLSNRYVGGYGGSGTVTCV